MLLDTVLMEQVAAAPVPPPPEIVIVGASVYPNPELVIIFIPPLIFLSSRITSLSDICIAICKYFSFIYMVLWHILEDTK